jgi:hypothetical protein
MKTKDEPVVLDVARALDVAERPARAREAAGRARAADAQAAERRRWGAVVAAVLTQLQPVAATLARWREAAPEGGALVRDRAFGPQTHEAVDRVLAQGQGLEEMVARYVADLQAWRDELAAPMPPERLATVIAAVREAAPAWGRSAESGLAATRDIRAQACAALTEVCAAHEAHIRWFAAEPAPLPKEAGNG